MRIFALCMFANALLISTTLYSAEPAKEQAVTAAYFEALTGGDVEKANGLSSAPYSLDRKSILKTKEEVEAVHKKIADNKGNRPVPKYTIAISDKAPQLDAEVFPKYIAFRIVIEEKEGIDIYVLPGETPKVIGFSD